MNIDDYIDRKDLSERLDGDIELFRELAALFIEDSEKLLNKLESSIKNKDSDLIRKFSHTLKGSVSNFSSKRSFDAALNLENIGKNCEFHKAPKAFSLLENEISNTIAAMKLLMKEDKLF